MTKDEKKVNTILKDYVESINGIDTKEQDRMKVYKDVQNLMRKALADLYK